MRRYLMLFAIAVAASLALLAMGHRVRRAAPTLPPAVPERVVDLALEITPDSHVIPEVATVPRDSRVRLTIVNHYRLAISLTLMGYQDHFAAAYVAPDSTWRGEFVADRPGDAFAWVLEGAPVGRLNVSGSHLVEGHR